jgi:hypothetical protein
MSSMTPESRCRSPDGFLCALERAQSSGSCHLFCGMICTQRIAIGTRFLVATAEKTRVWNRLMTSHTVPAGTAGLHLHFKFLSAS